MHFLRHSTFIAKLVLVWFVLFLGSAVAAAIVKQGDVQLVCTASGGVKAVGASGNDAPPVTHHNVECPLCASVAPPAPAPVVSCEAHAPLAHVLQPIAAAHLATATAPPLPSRGPPNSLL